MGQAKRRSRARKTPARKSSRGPSWGMLIIGLVSGSVLAFLILGAQDADHNGFGSGLKTLLQKGPDRSGDEVKQQEPTQEAPSPKAKLDFYTVLPKIERIISDPVEPAKEDDPKPEEKNVAYVLQAAAYENFNDADRLKAQLTITGFEAKVQKVTVEDKVYFRVRLGPYQSRQKLKQVEQQLLEQGIKAMSLKITDP